MKRFYMMTLNKEWTWFSSIKLHTQFMVMVEAALEEVEGEEEPAIRFPRMGFLEYLHNKEEMKSAGN